MSIPKKSVAFADTMISSTSETFQCRTPASEAVDSNLGVDEPDILRNEIGTSSREYILYFIRHGEALHNILEKDAAAAACQRAVDEGYAPNSDYAQNAMEEARKAILNDESMEDPPLSEQGIEEARRAKRELEYLISNCNLPPVQEVWVSPLQRAMKTASIIFPSSGDSPSNPLIRVKEELEERHTGLACDTASPFKSINRPSFQHFRLSGLRLQSMETLLKTASASSSIEKLDCLDERKTNVTDAEDYTHDNSDFGLFRLSGHPGDDDLWEQLDNIELSSEKALSLGGIVERNFARPKIDSVSKGLTEDDRISTLHKDRKSESYQREDKGMLRERTEKLFTLLDNTNNRSICLVGHKGYLRELERGPLGHSDAELFQNCELRVYRLVLDIIKGDNIPSRSNTSTSVVAERIALARSDS